MQSNDCTRRLPKKLCSLLRVDSLVDIDGVLPVLVIVLRSAAVAVLLRRFVAQCPLDSTGDAVMSLAFAVLPHV